ncbi:hypothetical protein P280DRAFT_42313 [Massarina eburnea CBS 473.64]|uniref:Regulator of phospholipase D SRF1 n=1 Tax=Massarina eburnea CBS 473.64 TaxID=1395130 RepID=A0A6A6RYV5_9PLEO|nr:hypothetical protein P280DRAFT_42313 [Massarina eburnea CBS 473.64]
MTGNKPMVEHSNNAYNANNASSSPFLSQSQGQSRLQPSPIPPPTASSQGSNNNRPPSSALSINTAHDRFRDGQLDGAAVRKSHSHSISSNPLTVASSKASTSATRRDAQRPVRTLPPWVQSAEEVDNADAASLLLPRTPVSARPPSHNYMPTPKSNVPGRKFDHAREGAPVTQVGPLHDQSSWQQFTKSIQGGDAVRPPSSRGQIVNDDWMKENMPDLEEPWQPMDQEDKQAEKGFWLFSKRKRSRYHRVMLNHPMVPLAVRLIVLTFSVMALSLAGAIFHKSNNRQCQNNSSTWMALIVDCIAILYTIYITVDEYTSKPLGLRSHKAKMRLIFLDLAFIVFDSANLSLAFQALTDEQWACKKGTDLGQGALNCPYTRDICVRQKALTATLLVALVAWLSTFAISTLRLLERVAR